MYTKIVIVVSNGMLCSTVSFKVQTNGDFCVRLKWVPITRLNITYRMGCPRFSWFIMGKRNLPQSKFLFTFEYSYQLLTPETHLDNNFV